MLYVGIDVGERLLEVATLEPVAVLPRRVANDAAGIARLVAALRSLAPTLIVLEATGTYHRPLLAALLVAAVPTTLVNPAQSAAFRQRCGGREKTDRADAAHLAHFGALHDAELRRAVLPDPRHAHLREVMSYRDGVVADRTRIRNRLHANSYGGDAAVRRRLEADLAYWDARLAEVDAELARLLTELPEAQLLQALPGVGPKTAAAVLGYLPPALWGNAKAAAAYAGVHPRREQSGHRDHSRLSKQGHRRLRRYLYLAAGVALKHDPALAAFCTRLQETHHSKQSARCAAMHKLLRQMMGVLRRYYRAQEPAAVPRVA
jgi:transposase